MQLTIPDGQAAGVHDGVAGPRLGGAWIFDVGRTMSITANVGIIVYLEALVTFGVPRD